MLIRGSQRQLIALRPFEVQVRRILPRHSDTTMKLDALLRSMNRDAAAECLGHRRCDRRIGVAA